MRKENFDGYFPHHGEPTNGSVEALLSTVKETAFYAPVLVQAFQEESDPTTIVTIGKKNRLSQYAIGAKLKNWNFGYLRLIGGLDKVLKLKLSLWLDWEKISTDLFRESLLATGDYSSGHQNLLTISCDEDRYAGMRVPIPGHEKTLIQSDLRIEFAIGRQQIAPANPQKDILWWTLTDFVPRFLNTYTAPTANVPRDEMIRWHKQE